MLRAVERPQRRHLVAAERRLHERTARVEAARGRGVRRARQIAREQDRLALALDRGVRDRHRREQRDRVRVQRVVVELLGGRDLDDPAEVHDRDPRRDVTDDREVVGDEQVRQPELPLQVLHQVDDLRLDRDVERGDRLVGDDEVRIERECAGEADALALAAAELVRVAGGCVRGQADDLKQLADALADRLAPADEAVHPERLSDDATDAVARVERRERVLEDHLHPAAQRPQLVVPEVRDVGAVEDDLPGGRLVEAQQRAADGGLAAAGLADETKRLPAANVEADVVYRADIADVPVEDDAGLDREPDLEVLDLDQAAVARTHPATTAARCSAHAVSGTGLKHATKCPGSTSRRGGTSSRDCSTS